MVELGGNTTHPLPAFLQNRDVRTAYAFALLRASLAVQVKGLRESRGKTIEVCAAQVGVSARYWASIEDQTALPSLPLLEKIAALFDVALIVRFASWGEWARAYLGEGVQESIRIPRSWGEEEAELLALTGKKGDEELPMP